MIEYYKTIQRNVKKKKIMSICARISIEYYSPIAYN